MSTEAEGSSSGAACLALIEPLTARELDILHLLCDGHSTIEISRIAQIGVPTAKYHLKNIFRKLDVSRRTQAIVVAVHLQLVKPDWLFMAARGKEHLLTRPNRVGSVTVVSWTETDAWGRQ